MRLILWVMWLFSLDLPLSDILLHFVSRGQFLKYQSILKLGACMIAHFVGINEYKLDQNSDLTSIKAFMPYNNKCIILTQQIKKQHLYVK